MLVAGSAGHAKEIIIILKNHDEIIFFDDTVNAPKIFLNQFKVLNKLEEVEDLFGQDKQFCLGLGGPNNRYALVSKLLAYGGELTTVISRHSVIGNNVLIGSGANIMSYVFIGNDVSTGKGVLVNSHASVHHDAIIGDYVEISPGARILGRTKIGSFSSIGSNAVVLPDVKVGENCQVGAGAVVTKNVPDNSTVIGVPARKLNDLKR